MYIIHVYTVMHIYIYIYFIRLFIYNYICALRKEFSTLPILSIHLSTVSIHVSRPNQYTCMSTTNVIKGQWIWAYSVASRYPPVIKQSFLDNLPLTPCHDLPTILGQPRIRYKHTSPGCFHRAIASEKLALKPWTWIGITFPWLQIPFEKLKNATLLE